MFRIHLLRAFFYPLSRPRRLLAAWLILPLSLALIVPPVLLGLGVLGTSSFDWVQGMSFSLVVVLVCLLVGALPFTFLTGYLLRCRKAVIEGQTCLPAWNHRRQLLADGGRMDTLALLIGVPMGLCFWGAVASFGVSFKTLHDHQSWGALGLALLGSGTGLALLAAALVCWLLVMLFAPMASLRLALGHSPLASLSPAGLWCDIRRGAIDYFLCCLLVGCLSLLFSLAQSAFWPLILVGFPVQVYLQLVWASLLGQYARAYRMDRPEPFESIW